MILFEIRLKILLVIIVLTAPGVMAGEVSQDWPEFRGGGRQGIWKETGLVEKFSSKKLEPQWSAPIGAGYSGPTVADGRVYVGEFAKDEFDGQGLMTYAGGTTVEGAFVAGRVHGKATKIKPDGTVEVAKYFKGRRHGPSETTYPDGRVVKQRWYRGFER